MTVINGVLTQLSVSEVQSFDPTQTGGCNRRWWFERAMWLKPDEDDAESEGKKGHALLATYFSDGTVPKGRVKMGKAVTGTILKGDLPKPGPDMLVEERFSQQDAEDAEGNRIPLDAKETLWLGGVPWDGYIDLAFRRDDVPEVWDHKFSSDPDTYAKKSSELIKTVQMPIYVLSQVPYWPDATHWRIVHHNVKRTGIHSFIRSSIVSMDQVLERKADVESIVEQMKVLAPAVDQNDVPAKRGKACETWGGCPHQSICSEYKRGNIMTMSADELDVFGDITMGDEAAPQVAPAVPAPRKMLIIDEPGEELAQILPPDAPVSKPELAAEQPQPPPVPKARKSKKDAATAPLDLSTGTPTQAPISSVLTSTGGPTTVVTINRTAPMELVVPAITIPVSAGSAPALEPGEIRQFVPAQAVSRAHAIVHALEAIAALLRSP